MKTIFNRFINLIFHSFQKMTRKPKKEPSTLKVLFRNYKGSYKPTLEFDDPAIGDEIN
jgi:hypothetical protein